jgi:protein involved in polysaccharide export with SLBB domain
LLYFARVVFAAKEAGAMDELAAQRSACFEDVAQERRGKMQRCEKNRRGRRTSCLIAMLLGCVSLLFSTSLALAQSGSLQDMAQQLGISSDQAQQLEQSAAQGTIGSQDIQRLCAGMAARRMGDAEVASVGSAMGLSGMQLEQLKNCVTQAESQGQVQNPMGLNYPGAVPLAQATPAGPSQIETRFRELQTPYKLYAQPTTKKIKQFGYDIFNSPVSTFAPVSDVPVGNDYVLGPGDGLDVILWGRVNRTYHLSVHRDGTVLMPQLGPIQVAGLTFDQAKKLIEGRASQITGVKVDVTMGQLRTIQVFVIGKVNHPGLYTVSALSHVSNALVAAGGISKMGSLRRIEVRRDNQVISRIDLYDMLLHGDTSGDIRLQSRDVIFVPVIGPVVGVVGDVRSPAIYELKGREDLQRVLQMAGGVTAFGYAERVQVERIENHQQRIALDVNLTAPGSSAFPIYDGDLIKVFTVLPSQRDVVAVKGSINQPGTYEWHPGMRVSDLVREAQGVSYHTFPGYALIKRIDGDEGKTDLIRFNLHAALSRRSRQDDPVLQRGDTLVLYSESDVQQAPVVAVYGQVRRPGRYPLTPGMKVRDLIYEAGGFKKGAAKDSAELMRTVMTNGAVARYVRMDIDLASAFNSPQGGGMALEPNDQLFIQEASNWHKPWSVVIKGQVERPGPYPIFAGERLATALRACGGFRPDAYLPAAVFIRQSVKKVQQKELDEARSRLQEEMARLSMMPTQPGQTRQSAQALAFMSSVLAQTSAQQAVGRIVIHLQPLNELEKSADNIVLQDKDKLIIPTRPASVQVLGQVYNPNAIVYRPEYTVEQYLQSAGGPTEGADTDRIYVVRANGAILTEEGLRNSGKNRIFPLLASVSGGHLMDTRLEPGDTIYVPEKLVYISGLQYATDVSQVVANSVMGLGMLAIVGANL